MMIHAIEVKLKIVSVVQAEWRRCAKKPAARLALTREVLSLLHCYYDFASSVALFQIRDCGRDLTQLISPINDRFHLSGLHEIGQNGQVLLIRIGYKHAHLLTHER